MTDSPEEALTYLKAVTAGKVSDELLSAYLKAAPEMIQYLEKKSHVRFQIVPGYSDYYPVLYGGKPGGGRTIEAVPFNARKLGRGRAELRPLPRQARVFGKMTATANDAHRLLDSSAVGRITAARIFAMYLLNPFRSLAKTDTRLTLGNALAGRLRLSLADRHVLLWLNTAAIHLIVDGGRVVGVEAQKSGQSVSLLRSDEPGAPPPAAAEVAQASRSHFRRTITARTPGVQQPDLWVKIRLAKGGWGDFPVASSRNGGG